MRHHLLPLAILAASTLASCGGAALKGLSDLEKRIDGPLPTAAEFADHDAVVIDESHVVDMKISSSYHAYTTEEVQQSIRIFKNIDEFAEIEIPIYESEKLTKISARTLKADGSAIPLDEADFHRITGVGDGTVFYSDAGSVRFTFKNVDKGDIVQYAYTKVSEDPFVSDRWSIQHVIPTLRNSYSLTLPRYLLEAKTNGGLGLQWRYKTYNYTLEQPVQSAPAGAAESRKPYVDQQVTFSWTVRDVPAFEPEPMMPDDGFHAYVKFAPPSWENWNSVASWYYEDMFKPQLESTDEIRALASQLTSGAADDAEKVRRLFAHVQGFRYVAIALGDGGLRPSKPSEVLARKYGDCKDKAITLISLLKGAGVKAQPVLVLTGDQGRIDPGFPNWSFNHMIVKAQTSGGDVYWLDPTATTVQVGELPWSDEGLSVLVLNDDGSGRIEQTPQSRADENVTDIDIDAVVAESGETTFNVKLRYRGEDNGRYRRYFQDRSEKQLNEFFKRLVVDDFMNAEIKDFTVSALDSLEQPLELAFRFTANNAIQRQGDLHMLNIDPFSTAPSNDWLAREKRRFPIEYAYPYSVSKRIVVTYPESVYAVRNLPTEVELSSGGLKFATSYLSDGTGQIVASETYRVDRRQIAVKEYADTRQFFNKLGESAKERLILAKK